MKMAKFSRRSLDNLTGVHPDLVLLMHKAIEDTPQDFTITCGVRITEQQQLLYSYGRSRSGSIVTYRDGVVKKSNHQAKADGYGHAVDLYAYPINVNDTVRIKVIAEHIKKVAKELNIAIEWGGDWQMKDYPHFELKQI